VVIGPRGRALVGLTAVALAPVALRHPAINRRERRALGYVVRYRPSLLREPLSILTEIGGVLPVTGAVSVMAIHARRQGMPDSDIGRALAVGAGGVLARRVLAETVRRGRPPRNWWWSEPSGFSYPSRHATWIALGCGALTDLSQASGGRSSAARGSLVGVVGMTRVALAVHWPSDVGAGLVFSSAWRKLWATNS
jgi:membrane-associated phospholipid phosphatase